MTIWHVHHGVRDAADDDAAFVERLAVSGACPSNCGISIWGQRPTSRPLPEHSVMPPSR